MTTGPDTFAHYQQPILLLAGELYDAAKAGATHYIDIEPEQRTAQERSQASERLVMLPPNPDSAQGPRTPEDIAVAEAHMENAARSVTRLALLEDDRERGGPKAIVVGFEIFAIRVLERRRLKGGLGETSAIDAVRRRNPDTLAA